MKLNMDMDCQEQLGALRSTLPEGEEPAPVQEAEPSPRMPRLDIVFERKGRGGKQATIICGFTCGEEELKEIASRLKKRLATGGSVRGGEILVQGDRRKDVLAALEAMGMKARII